MNETIDNLKKLLSGNVSDFTKAIVNYKIAMVQAENIKEESIFLDDERHPPHNWGGGAVCRSYDEWLFYIEHMIEEGLMLSKVSFDNDLGPNSKEGRECARYMIERDLDLREKGKRLLSPSFSFYVHSQNPPAVEAINSLVNNYLQTLSS